MATATETSRLSCKLPGGAIVHLKGGSSKTVAYGETIPDGIAEYVDLDRIADEAPRANPRAAELEAHRRAALTENGQLNSSSSVVPGNYSDLDEAAAARLMSNLSVRPLAQVGLVKHEILFGGNRQMVLDAASDSALIRANLEIESLDSAITQVGDVVPGEVTGSLGDPDLQSPELANKLSREALRTPAPATAPDRTAAAAPRAETTPPDGNDLPPAGAEKVPASDDPEGERHASDDSKVGDEVPSWDAKQPDNPTQNVWTKARLVSYAQQHDIEVHASDNRDALVEKISAQHSQPETPPND